MVLVADICGELVISSVTSGGNCLTLFPDIDDPSLHWHVPLLEYGRSGKGGLGPHSEGFFVQLRPLNKGIGFFSSP